MLQFLLCVALEATYAEHRAKCLGRSIVPASRADFIVWARRNFKFGWRCIAMREATRLRLISR